MVRSEAKMTMPAISSFFVRLREILVSRVRGQSMTEYVLIVVAIALVVYAAYLVLGQSVSSLVSGEDSTLTSA